MKIVKSETGLKLGENRSKLDKNWPIGKLEEH